MLEHVTPPDFDQLTQYVIEVDGVPVVAGLVVTDAPEPEYTGEPLVPYAPPPTTDERVDRVEAELADTREVIDVLFGGA